MQFSIECPHCHQIITEESFAQSEQSLTHLKEFFESKKEEYRQNLKKELMQQFDKECEQAVKTALAELYNKVLEEKNQAINKIKDELTLENKKLVIEANNIKSNLSQQITKLEAEYKAIQENKEAEIAQAISLKEAEMLKVKHVEWDNFRDKQSKKNEETQKLITKLNSDISNLQANLNLEQETNQKNQALEIAKVREELLNQKSHEREVLIAKYQEEINKLQGELNTLNLNLKHHQDNEQKNQELVLTKKTAELRIEKEKEIKALKESFNEEIHELKIKLERGMNIRTGILGSNLENDFEAKMPTFFPDDIFEKTTKAINGGKPDFKLGVLDYGSESKVIGNILFELKDVEKYDLKWEEKLEKELKEWNARFGIIIWTNSKSPLIRSKNNANIFIINTDLEVISLIVNLLKFLLKKEHELDFNLKQDDQEIAFKTRFDKWVQEDFGKILGDAMKQFKNFDKSIDDIRKSSDKLIKVKEKLAIILFNKIEVALKSL